MKTINIGNSGICASEIALGCMRINGLSFIKASELVRTALDAGIDLFDHADVYAGGQAEDLFGKILKSESIARDKIYIQTKCGIRDGYLDFSKEHIMEAVEGSLKHLQTDYVDILLLHRPDALVEPEEVAEAFSILHASGKVRHFGVSNQNPMQIALLKRYISFPLIANQLQFSIAHSNMLNSGLHVNMQSDDAVNRDGSVLDYCRLHDITIQPWSPFQHGFFAGPFLENLQYAELNAKMQHIADVKGVTKTAIAIAWILRHPAKMQPIVGTTNILHLKDICEAPDVALTRKEWYEIYTAAGNTIP
ncbi:MAG: aldo/keto reductase [Eubacteriales bacterium]